MHYFLPPIAASSVRILFPYIFYSRFFITWQTFFWSLTHRPSFERNLLAGSLGVLVKQAIVLEDNSKGLKLVSAKWQMGTLFINQPERPPSFGHWDRRMTRPSLHCSCKIMERWLLVWGMKHQFCGRYTGHCGLTVLHLRREEEQSPSSRLHIYFPVLFLAASLPETRIPLFSFLRFVRRETLECVALMDSAGSD